MTIIDLDSLSSIITDFQEFQLVIFDHGLDVQNN